MKTRLRFVLHMLLLACAASCQNTREVEVHFQRGFEATSAQASLAYNGQQVYSGVAYHNPVTGHPYVAMFRIGQEESGMLGVEVPGVLTNTFVLTWSKGLAVGLNISNGVMNCTQSTGFGYSLE